ncbi:acetyltransferase [Paenibacillus riograndensis]|nr:acetyltransferase [Paenibacillus riograndensis]
MFPVLEMVNIRLGQVTLQITQGIFVGLATPWFLRYDGQAAVTTLEEEEGFVDYFATSYRERKGICWGIERKDSPGIIGTIGFNAWSPKHKRAELGYELEPRHWRKGYAAEAASRVLAYGFEVLDLNRIGAVVFTANEASAGLLAKLGFKQEGLLRGYMVQGGVAHDTNVYSILKPSRKG